MPRSVTYELPIVTLDSQNLACDAIKIDTEGYEFQVIKGADQIIRSQRPVVMAELISDTKHSLGFHPRDVVNHMLVLDYLAYDNDLVNLPTWTEKRKFDWIFVPVEKSNHLMKTTWGQLFE